MFADYEFEKRALRGDFPDFTWCWSAIELQKYNTQSRSDTSDTSYFQKCSPNVVCYFWSPCWTFTLLCLTHISSSRTHSTHAIVKCSSPLRPLAHAMVKCPVISIHVSFHFTDCHSFLVNGNLRSAVLLPWWAIVSIVFCGNIYIYIYIYIFFLSLRAGGIVQILQTDWFRERAAFYDLAL